MKQAKYPDLNTSNQETLSLPLIENNQYIRLIPVVTPTQDQNTQQIQQFNQNNMTPYQEYSNYQVTQEQSLKSNLIKDQDFDIQKKFLIKILGIFILWTVLTGLIFLLLWFTLLAIRKVEIVLSVFFASSVISTPILIKVGLNQDYRNSKFSIWILIGLIVSYTIFYIGLLGIILYQMNYWKFVTILIIFLIIIGLNFIANFIMLIYLFFEETKIKIIYVYFVQIILIGLFCLILRELSYFLILAIPYPFCVMNIFKQILKGRFNLQDDQVITASIAAFYGMFVCCQN